MSEITQKVKDIRAVLAQGNPFGERVLLVGAVKMQSVEAINAAIEAGVDAVAENKVQEFREKTELLSPCPQHFLGLPRLLPCLTACVRGVPVLSPERHRGNGRITQAVAENEHVDAVLLLFLNAVVILVPYRDKLVIA